MATATNSRITLAKNDSVSCSNAHPKLFGNLFERVVRGIVSGTDGFGLLIGEFGASIALATKHAFRMLAHPIPVTKTTTAFVLTSSFSFAINRIVFVSSKPKVGWIHTRRIVSARTVVANDHVVRDIPVSQYPRHPVGSHVASMERDLAVPTSGLAFRPQPAFIRGTDLINMAPEPILVLRGHSIRKVTMRTRTTPLRAVVDQLLVTINAMRHGHAINLSVNTDYSRRARPSQRLQQAF